MKFFYSNAMQCPSRLYSGDCTDTIEHAEIKEKRLQSKFAARLKDMGNSQGKRNNVYCKKKKKNIRQVHQKFRQ